MTFTDRLKTGYDAAAKLLLDESTPDGHWEGELSSSPLSTATAIVALVMVAREEPERAKEFHPFIHGGLKWLVEHQNEDGGWGDTILSRSNISTATLCFSALSLPEHSERYRESSQRAAAYMKQHGGFEAIRRRYGKDKTFSVPILTQCALAELISWRELTPLPFELGWFPHWFFRWISLPVVSYALPALIAIGQARHFHAPSWNPLVRFLRNIAVKPTLRKLALIQPESGGFLEATPLTSFVTMSLASMKRADHPVARQGVRFLLDSVRPDGSWPIDTNLATWVTTLSVNALQSTTLPTTHRYAIRSWLLSQQHRVVHRYTDADPGGWAWTNLSGGVPDADDTPGAILALLKLQKDEGGTIDPSTREALEAAIDWLLNLQNRDGGWPTFCRGWGTLPFDRSTPDLTAHTLRAFFAWKELVVDEVHQSRRLKRIHRAISSGFEFLERTQRSDGTWLPLWFGNQHTSDEENPVYGTARALMAYRDCGRWNEKPAERALEWLVSVQNHDGGWGGNVGAPSSVEETSLAAEVLLSSRFTETAHRGLEWLIDRVNSGKLHEASPIGLYFAKLWYFERLYPIIFATSALARGIESVE